MNRDRDLDASLRSFMADPQSAVGAFAQILHKNGFTNITLTNGNLAEAVLVLLNTTDSTVLYSDTTSKVTVGAAGGVGWGRVGAVVVGCGGVEAVEVGLGGVG